MKQKPTYKELEQKIRSLENEVARFKNEKIENETILASLPLLILLVDHELRIRKVSSPVLKYLGVEKEKILGRKGGDALGCVHHLDAPEGCGFAMECSNCSVRNTVLDTLENGITHYKVESCLTIIPDTDKKRFFLVSSTPLKYNGEKKALVFIEDISERKKIEKSLEETKQRSKLLFYHTPIMIHSVDSRGYLLEVNEYWLKKMGYTRDEVIGRRSVEFMAPGTRQFVDKTLRPRFFKTGVASKIPMQFVNKSGEVIETLCSARAGRNESGEAAYSLAVFEDVSERKQVEELMGIQRDLGIALGMTQELEEALKISLSSVLKVADIDCGGIYVVDPVNGDMKLAVHEKLPPCFVEEGAFYDGQSPQAALIANGQSIFQQYETILKSINMTDKQISLRKTAKLQSVAIIPIKHKKEVIAVLNAGSRTSKKFSEFTRSSLEAVSTQVAGALARIRAGEEKKLSEERLLAAIDAVDEGFVLFDAKDRLVMFNKKYEDIYKESADLFVIGERFEDILYKSAMRGQYGKTGKSVEEWVAERMARHREVGGSFEQNLSNGRWLKISERKMKDGSTVGFRVDITDIKQSEERIRRTLKEKETLLREIHHRVKNNMQVVSSLLSLQAAKISDRCALDAFAEAQGRVHSMSLVHEILYQSNDFSKINAREYLEKLSNHLFQAFAARIDLLELEINTGDIFFGLDQAVPCGLIVTELITNALKYAFPGQRKGKIFIKTARTGKNDIEMTIADNGLGLKPGFDPRNSKTLGIRLVTELVEEQLEGTWQIEIKGGTRWIIKWIQ